MIDDSTPKIAVLLTCFNRKTYTLKCLESLCNQSQTNQLSVDIFLVDDASTDGTTDAVKVQFPEVHLVQGSGQLFWAGGMRLAWEKALLHGRFDFFWLINDDTVLYPDVLQALLDANDYSVKTYGKQGLYVGSTQDPLSKEHSYGGHRLLTPETYSSEPVYPNGHYQPCDFCNANIWLISSIVVDQIGVFCDKYVHAIADFDYSMRAKGAGFPVLLLPEYGGACTDDHLTKESFVAHLSLKKRIQNLYSPKGFSYCEFLFFVRRFFPKTYFKTVLTLWIRTLFPRVWSFYKR